MTSGFGKLQIVSWTCFGMFVGFAGMPERQFRILGITEGCCQKIVPTGDVRN
jgi:hypothetical protein